jgi:M6 family metalloprotease-like protein
MSAIFGELLNFPQENGPEIRLRVFGDEHYARYEDIDGYSVVYDRALGLFCYAGLDGNQFASTGVPISEPPPPGIVRHLQESAIVKRAKAERRKLLHVEGGAAALDDAVQTFGPNQGLLAGRILSTGSVRGLTILVRFQDVTSTTTAADVEEMLNGDDFTRNGNICSVREYFRRVSNGRLDYTNVVVGPFTLSHDRQHYHDNLLVREALELAVASGLDLRQFDSRQQNIVDAVNILYAGQSQFLEGSKLWPHNSSINLQFGTLRTNLYLLTGLGRNASELSIGTFCHENGHLLCRFPDMYDYGKRDQDTLDSAGIGHFCLMGAGNHLGSGRSPAPVSAYLRDLAGWCDSVVDLNVPGTYEARHGDYGLVMKFRTSKPNEYFLVENRSQMGLDRAGPSNGLAVYHCDLLGSNELQQGTADRHYQCALLQADGRRDLETNEDQGDSRDLFGEIAGLALSSTSSPHTREWDGRESGLVLSDISAPGEVIRIRVGETAPAQVVRHEESPDLPIPDNQTAGVSSTIAVSTSGIVRRIRVGLEITHTYIGDLLVELVSPAGRRAALHSRQGESQHDLIKSYDSDRPGELSPLVGQPMQGDWVLRVADLEGIDVGQLRKWSLEIESASV